MTVITLSRQLGSHGGEIATRVAQMLGLRVIDMATINQAAQKAGVPRIALAELESEGQEGLANQVLKALRTMPSLPSTAPLPAGDAEALQPGVAALTMPFAGLFSTTVPPLSASLEGYVRMVGLVIKGLAREGNVLILGRGGQVLLKNDPNALHIQTVSPLAIRTEVIMARLGIDKREAQHRVRASDRARSAYLRRYLGAHWLDPTLYHLVINTGRVPVATAVDLIIATRQTKKEPVEGQNAGKGQK
jgi:cytidylate kinase